MPTYDQWNDGLIDYLTMDTSHGSPVFLDINEEVLEDIGRMLKISDNDDWVGDFKRAVRAKIVEGQGIHLENIQIFRNEDTKARPQGIAFLGAMVLAAYYMSEDEDASSINYFKRLRDVFLFEGEGEADGRPRGMKTGSEERLWIEWGTWLQNHAFLPTAQRGEGPKTYINYPISQSLLRQADKDKLEKLFEERNWPARLDQNIVAARIRRETPYLPKHIQHILQEGNVQRFQALVEDIFEVYENWVTYGRNSSILKTRVYTTQRSTPRNIKAGLYRIADSFLGTIDYYLYPHQPHRKPLAGLQVRYGNVVEDLIEDGSKRYQPLWNLKADELDQGTQYELMGSSEFQYLTFPQKDFWILTPDADYPESGTYASGAPLELNTSFILLCKQELQNQITRLKNERLIQWSNDPYPLSGYPGWIEYRGMMVLSEAWSGVSRAITNQDLYESLRPFASISIHFEGGMRVPKIGAWLENYGPKVTLAAFDERAHLRVQTIGKDGNVLLDKEVPTNTPLTIPWLGAGDYFVEASVGAKPTAHIVQILPWSQLIILSTQQPERIKVGKWYVSGALIQPMDEVK